MAENHDDIIQLEYPHILFGDLALWNRTTTREPGELKYYPVSYTHLTLPTKA